MAKLFPNQTFYTLEVMDGYRADLSVQGGVRATAIPAFMPHRERTIEGVARIQANERIPCPCGAKIWVDGKFRSPQSPKHDHALATAPPEAPATEVEMAVSA